MIDPELAAMIDLLPKMDLADPVAARRAFEEILVAIRFDIPGIETLDIEDRMVPGFEGDPDVPVRVYRPAGATAGATRVPGILMIHGGGFVIGSVEAEHAGAALMAMDTGAVVVSVDYRLAPEHPYPAGLHDCYAALSYLHAEADALRVDPARVALAGASAGWWLWPRRRPCWPATAAAHRSASSCCRSPSSTTGCRPAPCGPSWTRPCGTGRWPCRAGRRISARCTARPTCLPTPRRPGPPTCRACRRPTSRRPRTTRCATRGSRTPSACCRPGVSVELHQFPGTFHGSALVTTAAVSKRAQRESALVLRQALGVEGD